MPAQKNSGATRLEEKSDALPSVSFARKIQYFKNLSLRALVVFIGLASILIAAIYIFFPRAEFPQLSQEDTCAQNNIQIDTLSMDAIYDDPASILASPEKFIQEDRAYQLFSKHRARVNAPFPLESWVRDIERLASHPEQERTKQIPYKLYQIILTHRQTFCQEIVSSVRTFLPEETDLKVKIYLTALEGSAAAFTSGNEIVFSLSSPLFVNTAMIDEQTGVSAFFNLALHELFHVGFHTNRELLSEEEHRKNEIVIDMLAVLHNEGMATYISYRLNEKYPNPFEWFIYFLDQEPVVRWYLGKLNAILKDGSPPPPLGEEYNALYQRIGTWGYRRNGLYIVGGHMAKKIEESLGKEVLVQTVKDGFFTFAETYNSVADDDMQVVWSIVP